MKKYTVFAPALIAALALAGSAGAQQQRPPKPDFSALAKEVGVPVPALTACLRPAKKDGEAPVRGKRPDRPKAKQVANCLGEAGYTVPEAELAKALKAARPPKRD
ncbi:hypothetical protein [Poseidonocella pacifica]|uniref:hypothetical protein n=1 Tax=Poseidonocella pacifica TaxID=871651 RepID=UPI000B891F27|nr:hypothetical protein [Poseidonocella pacifica]